jgi:uncharacterized membrane protein
MTDFRVTLLLMQVVASLLLIGLSVPLIQRKIPPNGLYGFRVPRTLRDPVVWYEANAYAGKCLIWAGLVILVAAPALCFLVPGLTKDAYAIACALVALLALGVAVTLSFRFLGRIPNSTEA